MSDRIPVRCAPGIVALTLVACTGIGCSMGPAYTRPDVVVPDSYRYSASNAAKPVTTLAELPAWWSRFGDPELDLLVREGLAANQDLKIATSRVEEFAARVTSAHAQGLPVVGYGATAGRESAAGRARGNYSALLSASWELDLWGRIRLEEEAARANLLATEQARLGVALTLVSAVVSSYVTLLDLDRSLEIALATLAGRQTNVELFEVRLEGGAVSDVEMSLVRSEYEAAASTIPDIRQAIAAQEHALSVLLGRNPGPIRRGGKLANLTMPPVPAGLPSELIARRPDILQSEQQLISAHALVGAARALYFPSLSLTGVGGTASSDLDNLFSGPAQTWSFVGQLLGPIFAGGAIDSANLQAQARRDQALAAYRQSIQNGFRDVEDSLYAIQTRREAVDSLQRRVVALQRALVLVQARYDDGYEDYFAVLDTERSLFAAELDLATAIGDSYRSVVSLYRALGGDWIGEVAPLAASGSTSTQEGEGSDPAEARKSAD